MQDYWEEIKKLVVDDSMNQIHVDTRDFHYIANDEMIDLRDGREPQIKRCIHNKKCIIDASEIKDLLLDIYKRANNYKPVDNGDFLMFLGEGKNGYWLKYIRMYRIKSGKFIVCNGEREPIDIELLKHDETCHDYSYIYDKK